MTLQMDVDPMECPCPELFIESGCIEQHMSACVVEIFLWLETQ